MLQLEKQSADLADKELDAQDREHHLLAKDKELKFAEGASLSTQHVSPRMLTRLYVSPRMLTCVRV